MPYNYGLILSYQVSDTQRLFQQFRQDKKCEKWLYLLHFLGYIVIAQPFLLKFRLIRQRKIRSLGLVNPAVVSYQ